MASYLDPSGYRPDRQELMRNARRWLVAFVAVLVALGSYVGFQKWQSSCEVDKRNRIVIAQDCVSSGMSLKDVVQLLGQPISVLTPPLPIERQPNNEKEYGRVKAIDDGLVAECTIYRVSGLSDFAVYYTAEKTVICTRRSRWIDLSITELWQ